MCMLFVADNELGAYLNPVIHVGSRNEKNASVKCQDLPWPWLGGLVAIYATALHHSDFLNIH